MRLGHRGDPLDARGGSIGLRAVWRRAAAHPLPDGDHLQRVGLLPDRFPQRRIDGERDEGGDERADEEHGVEAEALERRGQQGVERLGDLTDQAGWAWRVPHRRQKRAFAESDRPHCPQFWTPTLPTALATSRADASQNLWPAAVRIAISAAPMAAPRER